MRWMTLRAIIARPYAAERPADVQGVHQLQHVMTCACPVWMLHWRFGGRGKYHDQPTPGAVVGGSRLAVEMSRLATSVRVPCNIN